LRLHEGMTPRAPVLVTLAAIALGCSTTTYVGSSVTPESVGAIQREHPGTTLSVERIVPSNASATDVLAHNRLTLVETTPDRTIVKAGTIATDSSLPNADIKALGSVSHLRGALHGAGVGALIVGALIATVALAPCRNCDGEISRGEAVTIVGLPVAC
jgi:hypothetical protein